jgi:CelD/BcsL family acetyltransferase involved in cellulose biosynthesis
VKIAILDSGIDLTEHFMWNNRKRIKCLSFLADEKKTEDILGHGTHAAALLPRVARDADIYIAQATKNGELLDPIYIKNVRRNTHKLST